MYLKIVGNSLKVEILIYIYSFPEHTKKLAWENLLLRIHKIHSSDGSGCQMSGSGRVRVLKFFSGSGRVGFWNISSGSGRARVWHDGFGSGFGFFPINIFPKIDPPYPFFEFLWINFFQNLKIGRIFSKNKCEK